MRFAQQVQTIECDEHLNEALDAVHPGAAVFAIWPTEGAPYLGKTSLLRRRLKRLLRSREQPSRLLNLRSLATRVDFWPSGSRLENALALYELARIHLPDRYVEFLKLRMPPYVKLVLGNPFPRTHVTNRLTGGAGQFYGPFRSRAVAEEFERGLLDLFQMRRCQEDLIPSGDHPGCIYGEMGMCLRPCQAVVNESEYASEVARVSEFLRTNGVQALHTAESVRERMSLELEFEEAARQHKRIDRIKEMLALRDDLARDVRHLNGVAVTPSVEQGSVLLWCMHGGVWQPPIPFGVTNTDQSVSMDKRLRDLFATLSFEDGSHRDQQEHLAILTRWLHSSWCDGAWIAIDSPEKPPYRRLVAAISRTVHQTSPAASH